MVADLLKAIPDIAKRTELALHHADIFKQQNPRFKKDMFLAAAGVDTTINNISLSTKANEAWSFEFATIGQCSGTAGVRFTVVYSATPVSSSVTYWGNSSQVGNMSSATTILTTPAQSGTIWATATPIDVQAKITACFVNAGSANTVTIKFQPVNAAQTATLRAMTYMTARRIS